MMLKLLLMNRACFDGNTLIDTPYGQKKLSTLRRGDKIFSYKNNQKKVEYVTENLTHTPSKVWDFEFSNGKKITVTEEHTILTQRGWKKIGNLVVGESKIVCPNTGNSFYITHKCKPRIKLVYNLRTTGSHNFIANGVVAHNFTFARKLRSALKTLKDRSTIIKDEQFEVNF